VQYKPANLISKMRLPVVTLDGMHRAWQRLWALVSAAGFTSVVRPESHIELGRRGERVALAHLKSGGYRIVLMNFTVPVGQRSDGRMVTGEIDIVAYDESGAAPVLAFIEVKTRSGDQLATPESAIDRRKRRQIVRAARAYRRILRVEREEYRFDVVAIVAAPGQKAVVNLRRGYFSEGDLRRHRFEYSGY
jgi:putative endonuclease